MGRNNTLKDDYFSWLYGLVKGKPSRVKLCKELYLKKFRWFVHNDDNRCEDGLNLRDIFVEENDLDESHLEVNYFLKGECTVLEVMVALAQRMNDLMYDLNDTQNDKTPRFFLEMLTNLGLAEFTDNSTRDDRLGPGQEAEVDEVLEVLMDRTYGVDGRGGLFPLKKRHREDQSKVEIYYQMMYWLDENYG